MNKKIIKKIYFTLTLLLKKRSYVNKITNNNYLTILNLHRVSEDQNPFYPALTPLLFDELLKFITKDFNVITFRDIEKYRHNKKPNIILSFDDGFYDFLEYAVPILEKYKVSANQNVIGSCVETGEPVWDVKLGDILNQVPIDSINKLNLPNFKKQLTLANKSEYGLALTHYLKHRPKEERLSLWRKIEELGEKNNVKYTRMLNRSEVLKISKVHEIGAHSYMHESMGIESNEYFQNDFNKCQSYFKEILQLPLNIYTFPSGSYKLEQLNFLLEHQIKYILLVNEEYSNYQSNIYTRFKFYGDSLSEIQIRSLGWNREGKGGNSNVL